MRLLKNLSQVICCVMLCMLPLLFSFWESSSASELKASLTSKLTAETENFKKMSAGYEQSSVSEEALKDGLAQLRNAYKELEFLINYQYPDYAEGQLNGAPLMHIHRDGSRASVVPPQGLQKLDELIYSDELPSSKRQVNQLAQQFSNSLAMVIRDFKKHTFTQQEMIVAMRQQVVAIYTLGLTGFDTPGSARGIEESIHSLSAMNDFALNYFGESVLQEIFTSAISYLDAHRNFDNLDRMHFLKEFADPLYAAILTVKSGQQISDVDRPTALNASAGGIFDKDFLDPYYFTELNREEDSNALRQLGNKLFYDRNLSFGSELSCATCHNPTKAFTDGQPKSMSNVEGQTVQRNAPTLLNAVYADRYFYDLRAFTLEQQAEHVIFNNLEFNTAYAEIASNIKSDKTYKSLIVEAFGDKQIDRERVTAALTSYVLSLQSFNSPFDKYVRNESEILSDKAIEGYNLFMGKAACGTCHFAPTFSGLVPPQFQKTESEILGTLEKPISLKPELDMDPGRIANGVANEEAWIYERSFKTPTLRNVELTAPYFHNGAYSSLEQVMEFYNRGGGSGMGLEVKNQTLAGEPLNLSKQEIESIIAFMKSLTDNPFETQENPK